MQEEGQKAAPGVPERQQSGQVLGQTGEGHYPVGDTEDSPRRGARRAGR